MQHLSERQRKANHLLPIAVGFIALLPYINSLFFAATYDDEIHLPNSYQLSYWEIWTQSTWPGNLFRPVFLSSLKAQTDLAILFGIDPVFFLHLGNIVLHSLCAVVAFFIARIVLKSDVALVAALIFGLLPVHSEAVSNISYRTELLQFLFGGLSITTLHYLKNRYKILIPTLALLLAMLSKESGLIFIPLLLISSTYRKKAITCSCISFVAYVLLRINALGEVIPDGAPVLYLDNPLVELSLIERLYSALLLLGKYIENCLLPLNLSADYSFSALLPLSLPATSQAFYLLATLLLVSLGFLRKNLSLFVAWFFISFAITANIVLTTGTIFADRLVYTPSFGLSVLIATLISRIPRNTLKTLTTSLFLLIYGSIAFNYSSRWRDNTELAIRTVSAVPNSARANHRLGITLRDKGLDTKAKTYFLKAISIYPEMANSYLGLATVEKDTATRVSLLNKALKAQPDYLPAIQHLARLHIQAGEKDLAGPLVAKALTLNERSSANLQLLAEINALED